MIDIVCPLHVVFFSWAPCTSNTSTCSSARLCPSQVIWGSCKVTPSCPCSLTYGSLQETNIATVLTMYDFSNAVPPVL